MHNQSFLNEYFSQYWKPTTDAFTYSNYESVAAKIQPHEEVLDVGCGSNPFKNLLPHVTGIDPAFDQADIKCTIEDFHPIKLYDVALVLGSINFGDDTVIHRQIAKVVDCLKPQARIYWRLNPGRHDHANSQCHAVPFYPWTHSKLRELATYHGFEQRNEQTEGNDRVQRLYAEWHRG
jgi:hypothetical protein